MNGIEADGWAACLAGVPSGQNPYSCRYDLPSWVAWDTGWHRAANSRFSAEHSGAVLDKRTGLRQWHNSYREAIEAADLLNNSHTR